ncbi:MAG TPA: rRNA maturation RNase YbeY [Gammaproteobacteria bacterium]|jgi:probable rRNA maturation factor|nr:rRNA maturation RNase YbeY [Gammaproteobacteria bacterium]
MASEGVVLSVENASRESGVPAEADLRRWVDAALAGRRAEAELSIRIVDEVEGAALNATYRHKQGATNVLSFAAELPAGVPLPMLGDLVICAPVVVREAREQGKPAEAHWAHLVVHGCLHLLDFDHETEIQAAEMESLERNILAGMGYPDPYTPR